MKNRSTFVTLLLITPFFFQQLKAQTEINPQSVGPIYYHLQSEEMQSTLSEPYKWKQSEEDALKSLFGTARFNWATIEASGGNLNITDINQLRLLKDLLDMLPSDNILTNKGTIGIGGNWPNHEFTRPVDPCIFRSPTNSNKTENKLAVNYNLGPLVPVNPIGPLFEVNTLMPCDGKMDPIFYVDIEKNFGFGNNTPQAKYHFTDFDLLAGNNASFNFKLNNRLKTISFSNGTKELFKVDQNGLVYARRIKVTTINPFPDYVFEKDYKLMPLPELSVYLAQNKHLPNINSATDYTKAEGVDVGELQLKMLEKIEELTLYILQQEKRIAELEKCKNLAEH